MLVLVIDDTPDNRDLYEAYLSSRGLDVLGAADGPSGLQAARTAHPDVIVLDLGLPRVDGWEVARRLKADESTRDICLIAVTGHATGEARQRALDAGIDEYLVKPCPPDDVLAAIVHWRPDVRPRA
jgi:two-component system, sensor histidine kinase